MAIEEMPEPDWLVSAIDAVNGGQCRGGEGDPVDALYDAIRRYVKEREADAMAKIERLSARNDALEQVAKAVLERGHHDTCQRAMLGDEYECVCGYAIAWHGKDR